MCCKWEKTLCTSACDKCGIHSNQKHDIKSGLATTIPMHIKWIVVLTTQAKAKAITSKSCVYENTFNVEAHVRRIIWRRRRKNGKLYGTYSFQLRSDCLQLLTQWQIDSNYIVEKKFRFFAAYQENERKMAGRS